MEVNKVGVKEHFLCRCRVSKVSTITHIWQPCWDTKYTHKDPPQQVYLKSIKYRVKMSPRCLDFDEERLHVITGLMNHFEMKSLNDS